MAVLDQFTFECFSSSEEQTERLGQRFGEALRAGTIVALSGTLGAGKTHFTKGIGIGWGAEQEFRSPTFTMVQAHRRARDGARLYHIDLYRTQDVRDWNSIGLEETLDDDQAVCVIEWADRAASILPMHTISVAIEIMGNTKRRFTFHAKTAESWKIIADFRARAFGQ